MKQRLKKLFIQLAHILLIGLAYSLWYQLTKVGIPCLFHQITGLYCPGCGITRMMMALLHFQFKEAFRNNPVICVCLPILGMIGVRWSIRYCKTGDMKFKKWEEYMFLIMIVLFILFGVLRNLPSMQMLRPV